MRKLPFFFVLIASLFFGCQQPTEQHVEGPLNVVNAFNAQGKVYAVLNNGQTVYVGDESLCAKTNTNFPEPAVQMQQPEQQQMNTSQLPDINAKTTYVKTELVGIWKLFKTAYSDGSGTLEKDNTYLTLKDDGTFESTLSSRTKGNWFATKGWIEGRACDVLNLMEVRTSSYYNPKDGSNKVQDYPYEDDSFLPYFYYFTTESGTNQLVIYNLGSKYHGGDRYTFIKQ